MKSPLPRAPMTAGDPRETATPELLYQAQQTAYPVVAGQHLRRDRGGLIMAAGVAMLLGGVTFFSLATHRTQAAAPPSPATPSPPAMTALAAPAAPVPVAVATASPASTANTGAFPGSQTVNRYGATTLVYDSMGGTAGSPPVTWTTAGGAAPTAAPSATSALARPPATGQTPDDAFAQKVMGDGEGQPAKRMATPAATIAQGTLMPAVLETAIDTDVPGYVRAVISRDVRSFDGSRVLVPRSSHVIGQYKSAPTQGQSRVYVLWTRLIRPDGVSIDLGSPATDTSGRNGLGGQVNSHFGKRFGAAILLSTIGAAGQAIGGGGNTAVILAGPQNSMQGATQGNANIPPTIRVAQGQPILIFTAHDLDFSGLTP